MDLKESFELIQMIKEELKPRGARFLRSLNYLPLGPVPASIGTGLFHAFLAPIIPTIPPRTVRPYPQVCQDMSGLALYPQS